MIQLFSHLVLFVSPIMFIHDDTKVKCTVRTYLIGALFVLIIGTTLVKVVHIVGVFRLKHKLSRFEIRKRKTKKVVLLLTVILIEASIIAIMLNYKPISIIEEIDSSEFTAYKDCNSDVHFIVQVAYILLLQIICGIYAFLGRKLPAKYNEAKYMSFAMFTSTITMVIAIPLAYSIKETDRNKFLKSVKILKRRYKR